ncbi:MAG: CRISPR-associated helicase Cas3' [bacterium]
MDTDVLLRLWGKTAKDNNDPNDFHPAVFHMLDVGNVARELLGENTSPRWRNALARALNVDPQTVAQLVPYFVALHDIGKISTAFQSLNKAQAARLKQEGFSFITSDVLHPIISQIFVADLLSHFTGVTASTLSDAVNEAMGGHHGRFLGTDDVKKARRDLKDEPADWQMLRQAADSMLRKELLRHDLTKLPQPRNVSIATMAITGFAILCDWLGSDGRYFLPTPGMDFDEYLKESRKRAEHAVRDSGMLALATSDAPFDVGSLLDDLKELRPLQRAIDDIPDDLLQSTSLTIIEAPTGEGKTEAALALAHRIARFNGIDEMYYALPTMATSNQMFGRLQEHLQKRLGLATSIKLVHGQAFLVEDELRAETPAAQIQPLENGDMVDQSEANEAVTWFNSKKRALLAPFGVGTIDQAELAALNVKHVALRMMGLVGKVVIVDEVHAYDTYMTTIIERLLRWLATMNTSVILLSATLPKVRRKQLAQAFGVSLKLSDEQSNTYPSLLVLSAKGIHHASPRVWQPNRTIELYELHWGDDDVQAKAGWILNAVTNGGCVCWITNTVKRAQRIFAALLKVKPPCVELELLHSQFPLDERQRREAELTGKYGPRKDESVDKRPARGIVIGTQVLEQSLDLDFDVMVSDLAPVDLLLQRAGRLHRHDRERPAMHNVPRLYVNFEVTSDGILKRGTDRTIYAEFIIHQTQQILAGRTQIQLPHDYRMLIEAVYSDQPPAEDSPLYEAWEELQAKQSIAIGEAKQRLLPAPHPRDSFAKNAATRITFEEDENRADWIVAQTRLGGETLNVIPIERDGDFAYVDGKNIRISVNEEALLDTQRKLLKRNLRISHHGAIQAIQEDVERNITQLFKESKLLKGYYPLWLYGGKGELELEDDKFQVTLDPQLGLMIEKEGKLNDDVE